MAYRIANVGKTGILSIKKNGEQVSQYRPDLGDTSIDLLDDTGISIAEENGYLSIQNAFKEELSHDVYGYNSGNPTTNNAYLGIQKKYPVKEGDVVYLKFETTSLNPWYAITHYDSSGNYTGILSQGYGNEVSIPISYSGFVSFVIWTSNSEFLPSTVSEFKFFTHYVTPNNKLTDISAIGTDESGRTTASRSYTQGEIFYKDGLCETKTSVASGATWTLNTNYKQTTLAEIIADLRA